MVEIKDSTTITKKAPAQKTPTEPIEATEVTRVDELEERFNELSLRFNSVYSKSEETQKLATASADTVHASLNTVNNVQIIMPKGQLEMIINNAVLNLKDELIDAVSDAKTEVKKAKAIFDNLDAETINKLDDLKNDVEAFQDDINDINYSLEDMITRNDMTDYIDYDTDLVDETFVNDAISDAFNDFASLKAMQELESKVDVKLQLIRVSIDNKPMQRIRRLFKWIRNLFTPSK